MKTKINLLIYLTTFVAFIGCKKENTTPAPTPSLLGSTYGGGIVFYVDETGKHGLIAASIDQGEAIPYYKSYTVFTPLTEKVIGTGQKNTWAVLHRV